MRTLERLTRCLPAGEARAGSSDGSGIDKITVGQMGGAFLIFGVARLPPLAIQFILCRNISESVL